ncbi:MAG: FkbM family methyltransferase [Alphaproteobacteria bacterium]|nr:FkbM family methyltransferase [Alphaproteobacteria bacterium]
MPWKEHWWLKFRRRLQKPINKIFRSKHYYLTRYRGADFLLAPWGIGALETSAKIKEYTELTYLMRRCPELGVDTLIDVGANIGVYSCILLRNATVPRAILFEPDRVNLVQLRANLLINGVTERTTIHEIALGERHARLRLVPNWSAEGYALTDGGFSRVMEPDAASDRGYEVDVVRMDEHLKLSGHVLAIKIDVERYECQVIRGMTGILRDNRCVVLIEVDDDTHKDVIAEMASAGYAVSNDCYPNLFFERRGALS